VSATGTAIAEARGRVPGKEQRRAPRPAPSGPPPAVPVPLPPGQQERPDPVTWPETEASAEQVLARVPALEAGRAAGTLKLSLISVRHTLQWLAGYPAKPGKRGGGPAAPTRPAAAGGPWPAMPTLSGFVMACICC